MNQMTMFDYQSLPAEAANELRAAAERIKVRLKRSAEDIIEIGKELWAVKSKLPHGEFGKWVKEEFDFNRKTAQRFMQVAERFGDKIDKMSHLKPAILYALSAPSTPEEIWQVVIEKAEAGESISLKEIANLKAERIKQTNLRGDAQRQPGTLETQGQEVIVQVPAADSDEAIQSNEQITKEAEKLPSCFVESVPNEIIEGIQERHSEIDDVDLRKVETDDQFEQCELESGALSSKELKSQAQFRVIDDAQKALNSLASALESFQREPDDQLYLQLETLSRTLEDMASRIKNMMEMQVEVII